MRSEGGTERSHQDEKLGRDDRNNENNKSERGEEQNKGLGGERPLQRRPLDERICHVPGGAWLSQLRSGLRFSYFPF
ncbi:hypothetical protein NDU88_006255 [Pleurodeles waltl]|uniref:Uncharacterized protein n=1 Tax=Pleurodeles waltl TaxID=8319 RepID=A0AAV7MYP1_PLEWA|nr:hypothetical protein NDU88_006255 [Pleurodeles waltl]